MTKRPPPRTSFRTLPTPPDNPVQLAELAHLERTKRQGSARILFWLTLLAFGVSVGLGIALYLMGRSSGLGDPELLQRFQAFRDALALANVLLVILILTAGPVLLLETLLLNSDSIAREQRTGAWATLVLTPHNASQIVTGKSRAGQAYDYRHYGTIMILRAVGFVWLGLTSSANSFSGEGPDPLALLLSVLLVVAFLALNLALAGAASLLASFQTRAISAFGVAVGLQFALVLAIAAFNLVLLRPLFWLQEDVAFNAALMMAIMPVDSGTMAASQITVTAGPGYMPGVFAAFALINAALLAGLTLAVLRVARRLAVRRGALA